MTADLYVSIRHNGPGGDDLVIESTDDGLISIQIGTYPSLTCTWDELEELVVMGESALMERDHHYAEDARDWHPEVA